MHAGSVPACQAAWPLRSGLHSETTTRYAGSANRCRRRSRVRRRFDWHRDDASDGRGATNGTANTVRTRQHVRAAFPHQASISRGRGTTGSQAWRTMRTTTAPYRSPSTRSRAPQWSKCNVPITGPTIMADPGNATAVQYSLDFCQRGHRHACPVGHHPSERAYHRAGRGRRRPARGLPHLVIRRVGRGPTHQRVSD